MTNPTIKELQNSEQFELIAELSHEKIKEFVLKQLSSGGLLVKTYMIYQIVMILIGLFFISRSVLHLIKGNSETFLYIIGALVFCFSLLIIIHELLHGLALLLIGAKKINFGGYLKRFIFYAEADRFVINKRQFEIVALTPLVAIKIMTLLGVLIFMNHPVFYAFILVMSTHSLFCAGDIGLLSIFYKKNDSANYTYDVKAAKTSYYFKKRAL